jgi:hypothetical protein
MVSGRHLRLLAAAWLLGFTGCASLPAPEEAPPDWGLDPLGCLGISLQVDVPIRASILDAPTAFPGRTWHVLEYTELPQAIGFTVERPEVFRNVYRVTVLDRGQGEPVLVERYQVLDIWSLYPAQDLKICRQWILYERAGGELFAGALQLLGFNGQNALLKEIRRPLSASELEALAEVYSRIREHFRAGIKKAGKEQPPQGSS